MFKANLKLLLVILVCSFFNKAYTQNCADANGVIVVTSVSDEGTGSLRAAIECANETAGANTIHFDLLGSAPFVIEVGSTSGLPLPALLDPATIIDGRTQSGYLGMPLVVLDGATTIWGNPVNAIWIRDNFCEVYGLEVRNFPDDGLDLLDADHCIVAENYIHDNGSEQDEFPNVPGTGPWEGVGILIRTDSDFNTIQSNRIENNEYAGILVRSQSNTNLIGGLSSGEENVIDENAAGIIIREGCQNITIRQNSMTCNDTIAIRLEADANNNMEAPEIDQFQSNSIAGTAPVGSLVELFITNNTNCPGAVCQGSLWIGSVIAADGTWNFNPQTQSAVPVFGGYTITATATDIAGNTSEFAPCGVVVGASPCTNSLGVITVTNTNDNGTGSLREAINCANATLGSNTITFDIPGDTVHVIHVGSITGEALPALLDPATIIDASTQPGFGTNGNFRPQIVLDGSLNTWTAPINAIWVRADFCEIYALEIRNFPDDGIDVTLADYVIIGGEDKGNVLYNNGDDIDFWPDVPGTGPWNGCGIVLKQGSDYCIIEGNIVGTDYSQNNNAGNELCGIVIQNGGDQSIIRRNIIANHDIGIRVNSGGLFNTISENNMYCNDSIPIQLLGNANLNYPAPIIDSASNLYISGLADSLDIVEIFVSIDSSCINAPCQGTIFLGMATVIDSVWNLEAPFINDYQLQIGDRITATATSPNGNTSVFSTCVDATILCNIQVEVDEITPTSCAEANGAFYVSVNNALDPVFLDIGNGSTTDTSFVDLETGVYTLVISDANNCTTSLDINIPASEDVSAEIIHIEPATCDDATAGSFTVSVLSGAAPFTFDIGNGPQPNNVFENLSPGQYTVVVEDTEGCNTALDVIIEITGTLEFTLLEQVNESCEQMNGAFILETTGGTAPYVYDVGDGPQNDPDFSELSAGLYIVTVTDVNSCTGEVPVVLINEGVEPLSDFIELIDGAVVTLEDVSSGEPNTWLWDFDDGNLSTDQNPVHVYEESGLYEVCLTVSNECGADTFCEIIEVIVPLAAVDIGGILAKENGETVALVEVSCSNNPNQNTEIDGVYLFEDQEVGLDYGIVPYKNINHNNGCTAFDLFLINQHILGIEALDSPYKIIAADVDNSGHVSAVDLIRLQQLILFVIDTFPNNTSWRFVPTDYVFNEPTDPLVEDFPETIQLNNLIDPALDNDFVAIKIGDVNLNANPASLTTPDDQIVFSIKHIGGVKDELILEVRPKNQYRLSAFEWSIELDDHLVAFDEISGDQAQIPDFEMDEERNVLHLSWYDPKGHGIEANEIVFFIHLKKKSANWQQGIQTGTHRIPRAFSVEGQAQLVTFDFEKQQHPSLSVFPNPFSNKTIIYFENLKAEMYSLSVFDTKGNILIAENVFIEKGEQQIDIDLTDFPKGMYFYKLGNTMEGKLLKH